MCHTAINLEKRNGNHTIECSMGETLGQGKGASLFVRKENRLTFCVTYVTMLKGSMMCKDDAAYSYNELPYDTAVLDAISRFAERGGVCCNKLTREA